MQSAIAALTKPADRNVDAVFETVLRGSRVASIAHAALQGTTRACQESVANRLYRRWRAALPACGLSQVREWAAIGAIAAVVHLFALLLLAASRGPLQWVLPVFVLAGGALAWTTAPRFASARPQSRDRNEL